MRRLCSLKASFRDLPPCLGCFPSGNEIGLRLAIKTPDSVSDGQGCPAGAPRTKRQRPLDAKQAVSIPTRERRASLPRQLVGDSPEIKSSDSPGFDEPFCYTPAGGQSWD